VVPQGPEQDLGGASQQLQLGEDVPVDRRSLGCQPLETGHLLQNFLAFAEREGVAFKWGRS